MFPRTHVTLGVQRLKGAFEAPGAALSVEEASRLAGLDASICRVVLEALEDARFLVSTHDGHFRRRGLDDSVRGRLALDRPPAAT